MAAAVKYSVIWEGIVIGEIESIRCDNFHGFGRWHALESPTTTRFYQELKNGKELRVKIGNLMDGRIDQVPGNEIEFTAVI